MLKLYTDAAPSIGFGGVFQKELFAEKWPHKFANLASGSNSSALYQADPVLLGSAWSHKRIVIFCDNEAAVSITNNGISRCPTIMSVLRRLIWQSVIHNFIIKAEHIPGYVNTVADSLSRFRLQAFRRLCPAANLDPTPCPALSEIVLN
ncbi:hypothetical protein QQF64_036161 [Cirrhinus molitorella]|uniref:RNase H type-1 domain-containing protein n=1 Tax=Cirrhinus molitorella TaxID=172907 RepID=A0ABR3NHU0_9TELE